jgi:hypothetical protein
MSGVTEVDLWPKARFETDAITPVSVLRKQAALLGEKTQQLVTADVSTFVDRDSVTHRFRLVVPALDNYKYELFHLTHRIDKLYPLNGYVDNRSVPDIADETAFVQFLKEVLSSESTLRKIDSLMAQAKA